MNSIALRREYLTYLDNMGYLQSSFAASPYMRLPLKGRSLNRDLSLFSPENFKKRQHTSGLNRDLLRVGRSLGRNIPEAVAGELQEKIESLVALTDLPLEWALVRGIPLAFLCDVCRLPETMPTSIMSQFSRHRSFAYSIPRNVLDRTVVACGAECNDAIARQFAMFEILKASSDDYSFKLVRCAGKRDLFETIERTRPDVLLVACHGDYVAHEDGTEILIGRDVVTGRDIVRLDLQVPIVVLLCCWGTPVYGHTNTIAQAFFEAGSFSVVSTMLPISIYNGFKLGFRLIRNLRDASRRAYHPSWMHFVSYNLRTSCFDDKLLRVGRGLSRPEPKWYSNDEYVKTRTEWQMEALHPANRIRAYKELDRMVISLFHGSERDRAKRLLEDADWVPEYLYYTHLGRGDLIAFDSWREQRFHDSKEWLKCVR